MKSSHWFDRFVIQHLLLLAFYIFCNFIPFCLVALVLEAYCGHSICQFAVLILLLDYFYPLQPGPKGYWQAFSDLCDNTIGVQHYNHAELVVDEGVVFDRTRNYFLCYFPHSLYGYGLFILRRYFLDNWNMTMLFSGADIIFHVPMLRRCMTWWGLTKVSRNALSQTLRLPYPHNILMFQPDGIAGMFYGLDQEQIVLNKRKGFCRIALQTGASLVPCYVLGANQMYHRKWGPDSLAARLSHAYHFSCVYWTDRLGIPFGFVPMNIKMVVCIGTPIDIDVKIVNPTTEQVNALHTRFVEELKDLYDRNKHRMGEAWAQQRDRLYLESETVPIKKVL